MNTRLASADWVSCHPLDSPVDSQQHRSEPGVYSQLATVKPSQLMLQTMASDKVNDSHHVNVSSVVYNHSSNGTLASQKYLHGGLTCQLCRLVTGPFSLVTNHSIPHLLRRLINVTIYFICSHSERVVNCFGLNVMGKLLENDVCYKLPWHVLS